MEARMCRNIGFGRDGAANEFAVNRTKVVKLFFTLVHDAEPSVQVARFNDFGHRAIQ